MTKRYLYLLAWVEGSDGASGDPTKVNSQADLFVQYEQSNEYIFAIEVLTDSEELACMYGDSRAFHENYTGYDTVSTVVELDAKYQHPKFGPDFVGGVVVKDLTYLARVLNGV